MSSEQKTLRIISIVIIVLAIVDVILGLAIMATGGVLGAASGATDLTDTGFTSTEVAAGGLIVLGAGVVVIVSAAVQLILGILGLRGANDPSKIGVFRILCIIGIIVEALSVISSASQGGSSIISSIISLALVIWCFVLSNKIKDQA